jgi:hypothetical protein
MAHTTYRSTTEGKGKDTWEQAKDKGNEAMNKGKEALDKAKDAGETALEKAKDAGEDAFGKVKEAGTAALGKAREAMSSVGEMATETAAVAGRKAEDMAAAAGHGIAGLGDKLAQRAPHEGIAGTAAQAVADTIKTGGHYLEEHKISGMAKDLEQVVKNHPIPALLCVFGLGFCIGRMLKD